MFRIHIVYFLFQERRQEEYDLIVDKLRQEKKSIADELLASKEKLISLEGLNEKLLAQQVKYYMIDKLFINYI